MKLLNITIIATFIIVAITVVGCIENELLEQKNPNQLTAETFWTSEEDAIEATISCYAGLQEEGTWKRWMDANYINRSDEGMSTSPWIEYANYSKFIYPDYNFPLIGETWQDHYRGIFRPNQVLANVPGIDMGEELKAQLLAEAKFIRAFLYFDIVTLWGNASLWLEPSSADDQPPYSTEAEIYDQIEKDLSEAIVDLPETYDEQNQGRATRYAAQALLARVYMQQHRWNDAKPLLESVINANQYELMDDYADNFKATTENNKESIFEIQFSDQFDGAFWDKDVPSTSEGSRRAVYFSPRVVGGNQDNQPTRWVFDQFFLEQTIDGEPDPRLDATFIYNKPGTWWGRTYDELEPPTPDEIWFRKNNNDRIFTSVTEHSPNNHRIIRYADVLLLYAEVLNETGNTALAYQYINEVRNRANLANLEDVAPGLSQEGMRDQIEHERVMELTAENVRWFDLKRWGYLTTEEGLNQLQARDPEFNTFILGQHQWLPIPQNEMDLNPNYEGFQNPGY